MMKIMNEIWHDLFFLFILKQKNIRLTVSNSIFFNDNYATSSYFPNRTMFLHFFVTRMQMMLLSNFLAKFLNFIFWIKIIKWVKIECCQVLDSLSWSIPCININFLSNSKSQNIIHQLVEKKIKNKKWHPQFVKPEFEIPYSMKTVLHNTIFKLSTHYSAHDQQTPTSKSSSLVGHPATSAQSQLTLKVYCQGGKEWMWCVCVCTYNLLICHSSAPSKTGGSHSMRRVQKNIVGFKAPSSLL